MKSQKFETIEVAVRVRPLNQHENQVRDEVAWDIKQSDGHLPHLPLKLRGSRFNDTRRSCEILAEGQGRVLQLKNKHRFLSTTHNKGSKFQGNVSLRKSTFGGNQNQAHTRSRSSVSQSQQFKNNLRIRDSFSSDKLNVRDSLNLNSRHVSCGPMRGNPNANHYGSPTERDNSCLLIGTQRDNISSEGGNKCGMFDSRLEFHNRDNLDRVESHGDFESSRGWNNQKTERPFFKDHHQTSIMSTEIKPKPFVSRLPSIKKSNIPRIRASLTARKQTARNSKSVQGFCTAKKVKPFNEGLLNLSQRSKSSFRGHTAIKAKKNDDHEKPGQSLAQKQHKYNFDLIYGEKDTNRDVYEQTVRKVVLASIDGLNGTVFVYGQTGTGKTYTMMGNQRTGSIMGPSVKSSLRESQISISGNLYDAYENSGVLIFSMQDLFDKINQMESCEHGQKTEKSFQIKLSYIEIYHEQIYDLLEHDKQRIGDSPLQIHEGKSKEFIVKGANEILVSSIQEVLQLIQYGERNRHYAETFLNHCSSRSHTLFRLKIIQSVKQHKNKNYLQTTSYLNFVDLAGSEKISNYAGRNQVSNLKETESKSMRVKEGLSINKSLFYLTQVIHILSQRRSTHIPYRNSALTKILKSSLSGNSRTSIIVCITPASSQIEQTVNSLKFGQEAMRVQQSAKVQMCELKNNGLRK